MEYLKIWCSFSEIIEPLNDSERGRLFTAMLEYAESGVLPDFKGNERYVWPAAKQNIDRARGENDRQKSNGSKGGRPRKETQVNPEKPTETQVNPEKPTETLKDNIKEKITKEKKEENARAWASDSEVKEALERDSQIEDAAKSAGLNVSEMNMVKAREYARVYGMDKLLDAIAKTAHGAERITWAYVEGVLKKNGTRPEAQYRGNHSGVPSNGGTSGKYAHLFDGTAV